MTRLVAFVLSIWWCASHAVAACTDDTIRLRSGGTVSEFTVELAQTPEERGRGLMFREHMDRDAGMLFIFSPPRRVSFWMKNTLIPLDMLFIDRSGVVRHIHENAIPGDETGIPSRSIAYAVLEINGGLSSELGLKVGAETQHPAFGAKAAWRCP